jgi:hypothetical protein
MGMVAAQHFCGNILCVLYKLGIINQYRISRFFTPELTSNFVKNRLSAGLNIDGINSERSGKAF